MRVTSGAMTAESILFKDGTELHDKTIYITEQFVVVEGLRDKVPTVTEARRWSYMVRWLWGM